MNGVVNSFAVMLVKDVAVEDIRLLDEMLSEAGRIANIIAGKGSRVRRNFRSREVGVLAQPTATTDKDNFKQ